MVGGAADLVPISPMRRVVTLAALAVLPACGSTPEPPATPDAAVAPSPDAASQTTETCRPGATGVPSGHHNAGQNCLNCHTGTGRAPKWTVAGTAYTTAAGTAPLVGAKITIRDAAGQMFDLDTNQNGNFYTSARLTFPIKVFASKCPAIMEMPEPAQTGGCNATNCHAAGSSVGRIHL